MRAMLLELLEGAIAAALAIGIVAVGVAGIFRLLA